MNNSEKKIEKEQVEDEQIGERKRKKEEKIDEQLEQSFPASDPPSYSQPGNDITDDD